MRSRTTASRSCFLSNDRVNERDLTEVGGLGLVDQVGQAAEAGWPRAVRLIVQPWRS